MSYHRLGVPGDIDATDTDCSIIPKSMRHDVLGVLLPIHDTYQGVLVVMAAASVSVASATGPFVVVFGPFLALDVLLNAVPYIILSLVIDCDVNSAMMNEAKTARRNIRTYNAARALGADLIPGVKQLSAPLQICDALLAPVANGDAPDASVISDVLSALASMNDKTISGAVTAIYKADNMLGQPLQKAIATADAKRAAKDRIEQHTAVRSEAAKATASSVGPVVGHGGQILVTGNGEIVSSTGDGYYYAAGALLLGAAGLIIWKRRRKHR